MKVRYTGEKYLGTAFEKDKLYEVISIEKGWFRIMTELEEDYLFPPQCFEVAEGGETLDSNHTYNWYEALKDEKQKRSD